MKYTIPEGSHRARPRSLPTLLYDPKVIRRRVIFHASCKYELPGTEDDQDYNKLFGVGYLWSHHDDSARFGWYHDTTTHRIQLASYVYANGKRSWTDICQVNTGWTYELELRITKYFYVFKVFDEDKILGTVIVDKYHSKKIAYLLHPYFGGNQTPLAPVHLSMWKP